MSMSDFFTAEKAEQGIKLPLFRPDGTKSDHWIKVRGVDSREFRIAESIAKRNGMAIAQMGEEERAIALLDSRIDLIASLVIEWSFDEDCNRDSVVVFLKKAPQVADAIDRIAGDRSLFFGIASSDSVDGSMQK